MGKYGYCRVSTKKQDLTKQQTILKEYGIIEDKIYGDIVSSTKKERKGFEEVNKLLEEGDELVVVELTRLARSMRELVNIVHNFKERGVKLRSLQDDLDLDTTQGMMMFNMLALMAEFERLWIQERTKRSLGVARARGRVGGRKKTDPGQLKKAVRMYESRQMTVVEIQKVTGVSKSVLYDHLKEIKSKEKGSEEDGDL